MGISTNENHLAIFTWLNTHKHTLLFLVEKIAKTFHSKKILKRLSESNEAESKTKRLNSKLIRTTIFIGNQRLLSKRVSAIGVINFFHKQIKTIRMQLIRAKN